MPGRRHGLAVIVPAFSGGDRQTQPLVNGSATFTVSEPVAGDHPLVATYGGDGFFLASNGSGTLHVAKADSTTIVSCTPSVVYTGRRRRSARRR